MKTIAALVVVLVVALSASLKGGEKPIPNRMIDYPGFLQNAAEVGKLRSKHRVSEQEFIRLASEPGTIVFDARSDSKFAMFHIKGARHLSLPDVTADELAKLIPEKSARILIYCNNNFENEPTALPAKAVTASLNLYTFNTLYSYGYTNVFELGPIIDVKKSALSFEGSLQGARK
ncbi:MAG: sulfurtransferase [Chthoniobacterales bacterium]|nr:MAG: sulfurtransferase [Chthoniobacterales bacterium]